MTFDCRSAQREAGLPEATFPERLAATGPDDRALYGVLLQALASGGVVPSLASAAEQAGLTVEQANGALLRLAGADLVAVDGEQQVIGVFPLSAAPTGHTVRVADGRHLDAMCAVDALGIPAMLGQPGTVTGTDPTTGQPVTVRVADGRAEPDPPGAVVLLARAGDGTLASACCRIIDFYADPAAAQTALAGPDVTGVVLPVADAHALGVALFADLPAT